MRQRNPCRGLPPRRSAPRTPARAYECGCPSHLRFTGPKLPSGTPLQCNLQVRLAGPLGDERHQTGGFDADLQPEFDARLVRLHPLQGVGNVASDRLDSLPYLREFLGLESDLLLTDWRCLDVTTTPFENSTGMIVVDPSMVHLPASNPKSRESRFKKACTPHRSRGGVYLPHSRPSRKRKEGFGKSSTDATGVRLRRANPGPAEAGVGLISIRRRMSSSSIPTGRPTPLTVKIKIAEFRKSRPKVAELTNTPEGARLLRRERGPCLRRERSSCLPD